MAVGFQRRRSTWLLEKAAFGWNINWPCAGGRENHGCRKIPRTQERGVQSLKAAVDGDSGKMGEKQETYLEL